MTAPEVRPVMPGEVSRLIDVLLLAFGADPMARYGMPKPNQYLQGMRTVFERFAAPAVRAGTAYTVGGFGGAALWTPPWMGHSNEAFEGATPHIDPGRTRAFVHLLAEMEASHPEEDHWYLAFIGIDVIRQGEGLGAALMKHALARIDEEGGVAYLESSNPKNPPFYERFGFEIVRTIEIKNAPPVFPMVRPAQG